MQKELKKLMAGAVCFCLLTGGCGNRPETVETQPEYTSSLTVSETEMKSIGTTQETTSITEATETLTETTVTESETEAPEKKTTVSVSETMNEITEDEVRTLTNPLTKEAMAPFQVKVTNSWKVYWINVQRSDLFGLKPDDIKFFNDYINEHFEADSCDFYVIVTDVPDLCFQFSVTKMQSIQSLGEAFAGITETDTEKAFPFCGTGSCAIRFNDPEQFEIQGLRKDKYNIEHYDNDKIYHFPEFNDDMFAKLNELQEGTKKLQE